MTTTTTDPRMSAPRATFSASVRPIPAERDVLASIAASRERRTAARDHGLTQAQLEKLERTLRSSLGQLERRMIEARQRRIASRSRGASTASEYEASTLPLVHDERALVRHRELVGAIRRLEAGTYGLCTHCDAAIGYERLADLPDATHCAGCARRVS